MTPAELAEAFSRAGGRDTSGEALAEFYGAGRDAWPDIDVSADAFAATLAAKTRAQAGPTLADLDPAECYIASACAAGTSAALRAFEQHYFDVIDPTLKKMGMASATVEDIKQGLREKLFVAAPGGLPRIVAYAGAGALRGLVRVSATRAALYSMRGGRRSVEHNDDELALHVAADGADPALQFLRREQREDLAAAFRGAVRQLTPRERNLLRMHFVKAVSVDRLGTLYGVHRTTAYRWLCRARDALGEAVRAELRKKWCVQGEGGELSSMIESQLDVSLSTLLRSATI